MRTKVLLCAAALAASLASSMAQNVYSLNVVGYVNVTVPHNQFAVIANPLDATMGGTIAGANDNTNLITTATTAGLAGGSTIATFNPIVADYSAPVSYSALSKKWGSTIPMPPGVGVLYYNNGAADAVITFTGQVVQGSYNVASMGSHTFNLVGSPVPIGGDLTNSTTVVGLAPSGGDTVATFISSVADWSAPSTWSALSKKWSPTTTIGAGQGFLYYNNGANANNWVSNFTVQ